jgi:hypothetical protein
VRTALSFGVGLSPRSNASKKILLVDDSDTTRLTHRILIARRTGYTVVAVANGCLLWISPNPRPKIAKPRGRISCFVKAGSRTTSASIAFSLD